MMEEETTVGLGEGAWDLSALGWDPFFEEALAPYRDAGFEPARVAVVNPYSYVLYSRRGERPARASGKLRYEARSSGILPCVGDWVAASFPNPEGEGTIHAVLPRRSRFFRKAPGPRTGVQVLAANVDLAFVIQGLDGDFNLRRLERYLIMIHKGEVRPVVVLNKSDLCEEPEEKRAEAMKIAPGVPVVVLSAKSGRGIGGLADLIEKGRTIAFIGSSGVGKSTLINRLSGRELLRTGDLREGTFRGRHTTTRREMILLSGGGILIDTPGLREVQLWHGDEEGPGTFPDIDQAAEECRFQDCTHTREPQCGVLAAVGRGEIPEVRFESYQKLRKELDWLKDRELFKGSDQNRRLREAQRKLQRVRTGKKAKSPVRGSTSSPRTGKR